MAVDPLRVVPHHVEAPLAPLAEVVLARPGAHQVLDIPAWLAIDVATDVNDVRVRMQRVMRGSEEAVPGMSDTGMRSIQYPHGKDIATLA